MSASHSRSKAPAFWATTFSTSSLTLRMDMDSEARPTKYLELKEFLARNPCINRRTFTRWKKRGLIDCIQPGGPNTGILVPEDALQRIERRDIQASQPDGNKANSAEAHKGSSAPEQQRLSGPMPNWKKKLKQKNKESQ